MRARCSASAGSTRGSISRPLRTPQCSTKPSSRTQGGPQEQAVSGAVQREGSSTHSSTCCWQGQEAATCTLALKQLLVHVVAQPCGWQPYFCQLESQECTSPLAVAGHVSPRMNLCCHLTIHVEWTDAQAAR